MDQPPTVSYPITDLDQALEAVLGFAGRRRPDRIPLEMMSQAMALLGNPHQRLRVIHITGTCGKTSTAYYVRDLLQAGGFHTGMTISPHITTLSERVQVGGEPLDEQTFCNRLEQMLVRLTPLAGQLTYFELMICLALSTFADQLVDYAIVEVGIGGVSDATNIIANPDKVAVIGSIGLDHTEILGPTVVDIAAQKAGIMVHGGVAVVAKQLDEVMDVLTSHADAIGARLIVVETSAPGSDGLTSFQAQNWAMARATLDYLARRDHFALPDPTVIQLPQLEPPARYEWFFIGHHRVLLDGAHNQQEVTSLVQALIDQGIKPLPVLATLSNAPDGKVTQTIAALKPLVSDLIVPQFILGHDDKVKQSVPAPQIAAITAELGINTHVVPDLDAALAALLSYPSRDLLVTGSLYLAALVRPHLVELAR